MTTTFSVLAALSALALVVALRAGRRASSSLLLALLLALATAPSCYTARVAAGGANLLLQRRPVDRVLADGDLSEEERGKLELTQELRTFADHELGLPGNGSYGSFVRVEGDYVTWNVVAAPELSVEPLTWCFPVAGCVSYRGYFKEKRARKFAAKLARKGHDVRVGGVDAYSTLGRFEDPVLSTFLSRSDIDLAGLLFHEMAHQRLYVKDDTTFNESFATVVEIEGVSRWLHSQGREDEIAGVARERELEQRFTELLMECRRRLDELYRGDLPDEEKRRRKPEVFEELRSEYRQAKRDWGGDARYDRWFEQALNNAHLASVASYHEYVEPLQRLLAAEDGSLATFFTRAEEIASLDPEERRRRLAH
jgi:predicted aminopeptidase